eukprot:TRINITY_DN7090_c0_g2_i1.p1 TRINITY_DN7090_c0_g2~~TRINITY_DN7090_c0_g2_i1.p1  ORF type:complete len:423 (+),score=82.78 TRINITY_DN7090_c0_g2_i1:55-1323(+)
MAEVELQDGTKVPSWLEERFPGWNFVSLRTCKLRKDPNLGAGLDLLETDMGYQVEAIDEQPGQDPRLRVGDVIVQIEHQPLLGLAESKLEEAFGGGFRDGAEMLLLDLKDLQRALNEHPPPEQEGESNNWELLWRTKSETEYEAHVRIPVGRSIVWDLAPDILATFEGDLSQLGQRYGVKAEPHYGARGGVQGIDHIVLSGINSNISKARPELIKILTFYREGQTGDTGVTAPGGPEYGHQWDGIGGVASGVPVVPEELVGVKQFEYMDHTADIIVHSWGRTRAEAFSQAVVGMFQYMTEVDTVEVVRAVEVKATGHDLCDLLYHLLDEFLFIFGSEYHISRYVEILEFDEEALVVRARGYGDRMDLKKHEQGTEIKAITMHMMKILGPDVVHTEKGVVPRADVAEELREGFPYETYVLHDI